MTKLVSFLVLLFIFADNVFSQYYNGELIAKKRCTYIDSGDVHITLMASAALYPDSLCDTTAQVSSNCGYIKLNNINLLYNELTQTYEDTLERQLRSGMTWTFNSTKSVLPSFSVALLDSFPSIPSYSILPTVIHKHDSLYLNFGEVIFADKILFQIYDNNLSLYQPYNRVLAGNATFVSIPSTDLSYLTGENGYIYVTFTKIQYVTASGVRYKVERRFDLTRPVAITN